MNTGLRDLDDRLRDYSAMSDLGGIAEVAFVGCEKTEIRRVFLIAQSDSLSHSFLPAGGASALVHRTVG